MKKAFPTLGFVGTGAITTAMVTGFCSRAKEFPYPIVVSPRSRKNSAKLREDYPDRVTVAEDMQAVVDAADWVILATLPEVGEEIYRSLRFRPEQKIINVMFDKTVQQIAGWINCKPDAVLHMIPLTFNAFTDGPIVVCPSDSEVEEVFSHIGRIVAVEKRYHAAVFAAVTACVAPMYAIMDTMIDWAQSEGIGAEQAAAYVTGFFASVCQEAARQDRAGIHTMATTSTPGGINMQNLELIRAAGGFEAWGNAIRPVFARMVEHIPKDS